MSYRQKVHHTLNIAQHLLFNEVVFNVSIENARCGRIAIKVVFVVHLHRLFVFLSAIPIHHRIMCYTQHPRNKLPAGAILAFVKLGDDFDERFLKQVFRHIPVVYNEQDVRKQPRLIAFKQQVESSIIPIDVRHGQFFVGHFANLNHFLNGFDMKYTSVDRLYLLVIVFLALKILCKVMYFCGLHQMF